MPTTLKQPTDRRGHPGEPTPEDRDERRSRVAMFILALLSALFFVAALASAMGVFPFGTEEAADREPAGRLPPGWASLEPLIPLAPSLEDMADKKRDAEGGAARVLKAEGSGREAVRLRARPTGGAAKRVDPAPVRAVSQAPLGRPLLRGLPPIALERVLDPDSLPRLPRPLPGLDLDLGGLPNLPGRDPLPGGVNIPPILPGGVNIPPILPGGVNIPPINPLPGGTSPFPGGTGQLPLDVTVLDSGADPRFDVLLASSGSRVRERYVFRDGDISALAVQVNLRSRLFVVDVLSDGAPLEHVARASLEPSSPDGAATALASAPRAERAGNPEGREDSSGREGARQPRPPSSSRGDLRGDSRGAGRGGHSPARGARRDGERGASGRGPSAERGARSRGTRPPAARRSGRRSSAPGRSRGRGGEPSGRARRGGPPGHSSRGSNKARKSAEESGGSRGRGREHSSPQSRHHRGDD